MSEAEARREAEPEAEPEAEETHEERLEQHVRAIRLGHGANCSSVGSVIDTLFIGATLGGALFAAVCAAMKSERATIVGGGAPVRAKDDEGDDEEAAS